MALKSIIAQTTENTLKDIQTKILSMMSTLPTHNIKKRQLGILLGLGSFIAATAFGARNAAEIQHIANDQHKLKDEMNFILDTQQMQQTAINHLNTVSANITALLADLFINNAAVYESGAQRVIFKTMEGSSIITDTLQAAQSNRLAVNLLPSEAILKIYQSIETRAKTEGYQPLIEKANELFQIETSYLSAPGNQIMLLVHVPLVKEGYKFQLLKFIPFPLSQTLAHNASITPKVAQDLLAIRTKRGRTEYQILATSDLIGCTKLGNNFKCPGRSILRTQLEDTCLGSLYHQHLQGVLRNCEFEVRTDQEHVFELSNNQFLVSSPQPFHTTIECGEDTHTVKLTKLSQIHIQGGCEVTLRQHTLRPELNLFTDFGVINFEWTWDPTELFPSIPLPEIATIIDSFKDSGIHTLNVKEIAKWKLHHLHPVSPMTNLIILVIVFALLFSGLIVLCFYYKCNCYRWDSCALLPRDRVNYGHGKTQQQIDRELQPIASTSADTIVKKVPYPDLSTCYEIRT
jgi:hypothetical protein